PSAATPERPIKTQDATPKTPTFRSEGPSSFPKLGVLGVVEWGVTWALWSCGVDNRQRHKRHVADALDPPAERNRWGTAGQERNHGQRHGHPDDRAEHRGNFHDAEAARQHAPDERN